MGKRLLENESRNFPRGLKKISNEDLQKLSSDYGLSRVEDLFAAVGFGKYSARQVLSRYFGETTPEPGKPAEDAQPTLVKTVNRMLGMGKAPMIVKRHHDFLVFLAKWCKSIQEEDSICEL